MCNAFRVFHIYARALTELRNQFSEMIYKHRKKFRSRSNSVSEVRPLIPDGSKFSYNCQYDSGFHMGFLYIHTQTCVA
jgi:hypothetical protein